MQSSTLSQSQLQTEIKTHDQNAIDTLWQFESITNFHLLKLHRIQSLLQDILLEKTGIGSRPTRAQDIARALEDCQHLQGELFEQSYNLTAQNELFHIDEAFNRLQSADISTQTPYSN